MPIHNIMEEKPAKSPPWMQAVPPVVFDLCKNKKAETQSTAFEKEFSAIREHYKNYVEVYTDGSKDGNRVGFAAHTPYGNRKKALHGKSSIFTAEAHAILSALEWMKVSGSRKYIVFSDSKSCLQAICQHDCRNPVIQAIRD